MLVAYVVTDVLGMVPNGLDPIVVATLALLAVASVAASRAGPLQEVAAGAFRIRFFEKKIEKLEDDVGTLEFVVRGLVTRHMLSHLRKLADTESDWVRFRWSMYSELEHLQDVGYVVPNDERGLQALISDHEHSDEEFHLKRYLQLTSTGWEYLRAWEKVSGEAGKLAHI
ncbi:hypothetical protein [Streptomyces sp. NBC_00775]|uniref:hypothetical protein n=1 Tax=Streptomyces sp. NBC_00775 TaxID=2975828 RepID=UPI002ED447AD|nr:hypothetical protein OIC96_21980 [Streptomyces sp. NBC_00775]